jgi:glycosyltransferase involved in cell wall biosynthesis
MRVLQVHWTFPPTTGGVESHVADLSAGLAARGCQVTVLTGEPAPEQRLGVTHVRSEVLDLRRIRAGLGATGSYRQAVLRDMQHVLTSVRPDVVHGHNLHHFAAAPALALGELSCRQGLRMYHTFHETWPDLLHDEPVYRGWAGNYAVSRHVRDECGSRLGFWPSLRPLGVDTARFRTRRPAFSGEDVPVILHPARLLPWKGVHVSLRMLSLLAARGVPAQLILTDTARIADWEGELSAYRASILDLINALGLGGQVELRAVSYRDMPGLYEEADVVIYPTVAAEPLGLVPLEAMSSRRPVVASRCGGIPETVVDGITGRLVDPGAAEALAERVTSLVADPGLARRMGEAGRQHIRAHFDLQGYSDGVLNAYRSCLDVAASEAPRSTPDPIASPAPPAPAVAPVRAQ